MRTLTNFGKYEIIGKIGSGGMGDIYLAIKEGKIRYPVAIKILHSHLLREQEYIELFKKEIKALNLLKGINHPNIVKIFDIGTINNNYYIEMEYIPGYNLKEVINKVKKLKKCNNKHIVPIEHVIEIGIEVCYGLEYIHTAIIAHRDISPSNILLSEFGEVKIIDFGIAKLDDTTGVLMGTLSYMSPEQIERIELDGRSDIYSLGMILFELITGKRPDHKGDEITLKNLGVSQIVAKTIQKAFSKKREKRYYNATQFREALEECRQDYLKMSKKISGKGQIANFLLSLSFDDTSSRRFNYYDVIEDDYFEDIDLITIVSKNRAPLPMICKLASI